MFHAIWQGILTGLVVATFVGPIFFAVINFGLQGNIKGAAYLAFGTFVSDISTVFLIYLIAKGIDRNSAMLQIMYVVGGVVLIILGLQNIIKAKVNDSLIEIDQKHLWKLFAKGFLINFTNPNVFFFLFGAVMVAVHTYSNRASLVLLHFTVALVVVFSTDFLKGYVASLLRKYAKDNILLYLSRLSGVVLIYFGVKLIFFH